MKRRSPLAAISLAVVLAGCSTTYVPLNYGAAPVAPPALASDSPAKALVSVVDFADARNISYGADWLGAIRGGYGNELKRLRAQKPISQVVADAFADGLRARGVYADPGQGKVTLGGTVTKLDCSEYFNLEAHAHLKVTVADTATKATIFEGAYDADQTEGGFGAGIFASVETLRLLAEKTLRESVDEALDDPKLREAIQGPK
jgi:hypothetical protein